MKKIMMAVLVMAVALVFGFSANAGDAKVKVKEEVKGNTEIIKAEAKDATGKEVLKATRTGDDVNVIDATKFKSGALWKDTVTFHEYKSGADYVYVMRDDKVYKVKLHKDAKQYVMEHKKGDPITIYSTYPLMGPEIAKEALISKIEKADLSSTNLATKKNKKNK